MKRFGAASCELKSLPQELPSYAARKALLARDPMACLDGFLVLVGLALRHIFGVRFCPRCPECNTSGKPCADAFGSNAIAMGGAFGRVDAVYGSIECQKSGALHLHLQVFVQCSHQFQTMTEILRAGRKDLLELLRRYSDYTAHVSRKVYSKPEDWIAWKRAAVEEQWPEYKDSTLLLSRPAYQQDAALDAMTWAQVYLMEDVEELQQHKQHHVHLPDDSGKRQPLAHCRDPANPAKCKSGFPRTKWITDEPLLLCPGLAKKMDMPYKGKKSMVGLPYGPCNDPDLNGTHPALLAALRCNSDVQPPYRFPILPPTIDNLPGTHADHLCDEKCDQKVPIFEIARQIQISQAAQVGYQCDYQNKRLPCARHEMKDLGVGPHETTIILFKFHHMAS